MQARRYSTFPAVGDSACSHIAEKNIIEYKLLHGYMKVQVGVSVTVAENGRADPDHCSTGSNGFGKVTAHAHRELCQLFR